MIKANVPVKVFNWPKNLNFLRDFFTGSRCFDYMSNLYCFSYADSRLFDYLDSTRTLHISTYQINNQSSSS